MNCKCSFRTSHFNLNFFWFKRYYADIVMHPWNMMSGKAVHVHTHTHTQITAEHICFTFWGVHHLRHSVSSGCKSLQTLWISLSQWHNAIGMSAMPLQSTNLPAEFSPNHFQLKAGECHYCYCLQAGNNLMEMIPFKRSLLSFWLSGKMIVSSLRLDKIKTPSEYLIIDQEALGVSWLYSFSERLTAFQRGF